MPSWRALDAKAPHELPVLSVTEQILVSICRLLPTGAAYDPARVVMEPYVAHMSIRHTQRADRRLRRIFPD
ncbi:hypothetical protein BH23CHL9_BH23CHL9_14540 [soil metagenome]